MQAYRYALTILATFAIGFILHSSAVFSDDCNRDCNAECCQTISITPWDKNRVCEPLCKSTCEVAKSTCQATGGRINLPNAPNIIREVEQALNQGCAAGFEVVTKGVLITQGFYGAGSERAINQAKELIIRAGVWSANDMAGVTIRWCRLDGAEGMAPDRNVICLSDEHLNTSDIVGLAATLSHELYHAHQYRQLGTDNFKCRYSREFVSCGGCQDERQPLEREAYDFEARALPRLQQASRSGPSPTTRPSGVPTPGNPGVPPPLPASMCHTPAGSCPMGIAIPQGSPCYCQSMMGLIWGQAF